MLNSRKNGLITKSIFEGELDPEIDYEYIFDTSIDLIKEGESLDNLLNFRIFSGVIYYDKTKELVIGIQLTFKNIKQKQIIPIKRKFSRNWTEGNDIEKLKFNINKKEYLSFITFRKNESGITQIKLETNKGSKFQIGNDIGDKIELLPQNNDKFNLIVGIFGSLENLGIIYIDIYDFIKKYYSGYSELRLKLDKDEGYKKQMEDKYNELSEENKYIYQTALLPKVAFNSVLKFILTDIK